MAEIYWTAPESCASTAPRFRAKSETESATVRCCSHEGTQCASMQGAACLPQAVPYKQAVATCAGLGMRLCTKEEMWAGVCCGATTDQCRPYGRQTPEAVWTSAPVEGVRAS